MSPCLSFNFLLKRNAGHFSVQYALCSAYFFLTIKNQKKHNQKIAEFATDSALPAEKMENNLIPFLPFYNFSRFSVLIFFLISFSCVFYVFSLILKCDGHAIVRKKMYRSLPTQSASRFSCVVRAENIKFLVDCSQSIHLFSFDILRCLLDP